MENKLSENKLPNERENKLPAGNNSPVSVLEKNDKENSGGFKKFFTWQYYGAILSGKISYHVFLAFLILSLISVVPLSYSIYKYGLPFSSHFSANVQSLITEVVPADLEITIKNGAASTNVTEPYYVTVKKEYLENIFGVSKTDSKSISKIRLLTIDTKGKAEDFERYQSLALLTQSSIVYYSDNKINIQPLASVDNVTINRQTVEKAFGSINKGDTFGKILFVIVLVAPLFIFIFVMIGLALGFLYFAFLSYIMSRLYKTGAKFGNVYSYTVAIMFIPLLIWTILVEVPVLNNYLLGLDDVHTIVVIGIAYLGIRWYAGRLDVRKLEELE